MKYDLIIFDMDGLMFDTEIFYYKSWKAFEDKYNFRFDIETRNRIAGMNEANIRDEFAKIIGDYEKAGKLRQEVNDYREKRLSATKESFKKEGLVELLDFLKASGIRACIASSSDREKILYLIEKENIKDYFDFVVSGEDFENSKPNPEIFEKTAQIANVDKSRALILEDSHNGYLAAKASGIDYLIIHDKSFERTFTADREVDSLLDVIDYIKDWRSYYK